MKTFPNPRARHSAYYDTLGSKTGAKVLRDIFAMASVYRTTYTRGDPYETAFQEGRRSLALSIAAILKTDPAQFEGEENAQ